MNKTEIDVLEINGERYFLVDNLEDDGNKYYYFSKIASNGDVLIMKEVLEDNEEVFISIENNLELEYALNLFLDKHNNVSNL